MRRSSSGNISRKELDESKILGPSLAFHSLNFLSLVLN